MRKFMQLSGALLVVSSLTLNSCGKNKCHECHYDLNGQEVDLGEYCGDDLKSMEANGYTDSLGVLHEVHCHKH